MSNTVYYKAATRGHADHGWLESHQSFSFADYYNPERIQFGTLRVLNDDRVDGGKGFGSHPHDNMEIISIPLAGSLVHEDNMGNRRVVGSGEVQVMSTGSGVFHSEYNNSPDQPAKFLQIWVFPNRLNGSPRYDQIKRDPEKEHNQLQTIISPAGVAAPAGPGRPATAANPGRPTDSGGSPSPAAPGTWIYQDAWFQIGHFDKGKELTYQRQQEGNGIYLFVISGSFQIGDQVLNTRDGLGIDGQDRITATAGDNDSEILIMEVPMHNKIK
jgi:redox-sensitive bicupin YhaK (pirin superfamily)